MTPKSKPYEDLTLEELHKVKETLAAKRKKRDH